MRVMDLQVVLNQMAVLFILIAIGFLAAKVKTLTPDGVKTLSKVVINISTPCMILNSVFSDTGYINMGNTSYFLLMTLLAYVILFLFAIPAGRALGTERAKAECGTLNSKPDHPNRGLYCSMIAFGNVGFMGFPVSNAIFGARSMFYVALINIVFQTLLFSVGIILVSRKGGKVNLKLLLNAPLFSSIAAFFIIITGIRSPAIVTEAVRITSALNTPCAMFVIGATLAQVPVKNVFTEWRLYPMMFIKMVVIPVVIWFVFKQFVADDLMLGVLVVIFGMPIAAALPMIAVEYGGDERLASAAVFLTTMFSAVTTPLVVYFFLI